MNTTFYDNVLANASFWSAVIAALSACFVGWLTWRSSSSKNRIDLAQAGLQAQLVGWENLSKTLSSRIIELEKDIDRYSNRVEVLEKKLQDAEQRERTLTSKLNTYENKINTLNSEITFLRKRTMGA